MKWLIFQKQLFAISPNLPKYKEKY